MGLDIPKGIEATCDEEGCTRSEFIPIRYISSGFKKITLFNKLRKAGWYIAKKGEDIICPDCAISMGIKRKGKGKNKNERLSNWDD